MAPARRRGSGRAAAAAAAARQQWKVGDLVLAKMKGFPAWPAMISDPKKWGYSSDRKKLLVFFFGTKQIAFCNHVDVEAFTEEKKKTLLMKRQGKGTDFVRAVDEIIESYEKSQLQKHNDELDSGDEGVGPNARNLEGSSGKLSLSSKNSVRSIDADQSEDCNSLQNNNGYISAEKGPALMENNDHNNVNTYTEQLTEKVSILEELRQTPLASNTSSRKRSRDVASQTCVVQKRAPSLRRSRSSARVDPFKLQKSEPSTCKVDSTDDKFSERNKSPKKSIDSTVSHDIDTPSDVLVSDGDHKYNGSGLVSLESKTIRLDADEAFQSKCRDELSTAECSDEGKEMNGQVDCQMRSEVHKKNIKPNKVRITQRTLDEESHMLIDISKNFSSSLNSCSKINVTLGKTDGDEHLPLVKRARARMGEPSVGEKQSDVMVGACDKSEEVSIKKSDKDDNLIPNNYPEVTTSVVSSKARNGSSSKDCAQVNGNEMLLKVKSFNLRGSAMDAEAALPPSKRLHRALEAMSANAAEARGDGMEAPCVPEILSSECKDSPAVVSVLPEDSAARSPQESNTKCSDHDLVFCITSRSASSLISKSLEEPTETSLDVKPISHCLEKCICPQNEDDFEDSLAGKTVKIEVVDKTPAPCFPESSDKKINDTSSILTKSSSPVIEGKMKTLQLYEENTDYIRCQVASAQVEKLEGENGSVESNIPEPKADNCNIPLNINCDAPLDTAGDSIASVVSGSSNSSSTVGSENVGDREVKQATGEVKQMLTPKDLVFSPDSTPMKVLIAAAQAKRLSSLSSSVSDSAADIKPSSDGMSSASPFCREDSSEQFSSHSDRNNFLHGRSPDANPQRRTSTHQQDVNGSRFYSSSVHQQKAFNKFSAHAEASAALKSFEAIICTLTRAKESIGRATQRAIECAKYGVAGEVVEVLLSNLEKEPSLHRRVDLFFLVDSITRNSRGQKGVAGDIYPSLFLSELPRLLGAAAPPGNAAWENRRQCLKVLRLWLERKTLPEAVIRHHIRELDYINEGSYINGFSRRPSRTERALDDPVREMDGMLDEYGSNTSFQIPGLLNSRIFADEEEGTDTDEKSFEAVTPEQDPKIHGDIGSTLTTITEKHKHILEDVDGELEMEDVAPCSEVETSSLHHIVNVDTPHVSHYQCDQHPPLPFSPPLPEEEPPSPPPLPSSPPPEAPLCPLPSVLPLPSTSKTLTDFASSNLYVGTNSCLPQSIGLRQSATNINTMPSDTTPYYGPGYRDHPKHLAPAASAINSACSNGNNTGCHSSAHPRMNDMPIGCEPTSNKAFYLQPPPPTISTQFSYMQAEPPHQPQSLGKFSSSPLRKSFHLGHDPQCGNFYSDGTTRGVVQHDSCGFAAAVPSGPVTSEKIDISSSSLSYYGPPSESSPIPGQGWSHPPKVPSYQYSVPASRPMETYLPRMTGAPAYWRPR